MSAFAQEDNSQLSDLFNQDQKMRTNENIKNWPMFSPLEERNFRIEVFRFLASNEIKTANDYFHASIILIHSFNYGHENFILASFLAEKAIELGHEKGKFALESAVAQYSLHNQLPSNEWTLYSLNNHVVTKQVLDKNLINNNSTTNIKTQK